MHELFDQLRYYRDAVWRYRWHAVLLAWVVALVGWASVYFVPNRYEASARVFVDTQSVLKPLLVGLAVQPNVDQVVTMMSRTLISRPNMEKVIRMADLDINLKTPDQRERMIDHLAKTLKVTSAGRENLYTISFADNNPQEAKRIVQSLLTIFVEGSLGDKRKDSDTARRFLDEQLKAYSEKLAAAEAAVTEFKRQRMGMMPGQGGNFYSQLGEAKTLLDQAALNLREAENSRDAIKQQMAGDTPMLLDDRPAVTPEIAAVQLEIDRRIQGLQEKLDNMRLTYTEHHPDVQSVVRIIAQLREQRQKDAKLAEQKMAELKLKKPAVAPPPSPSQSSNPVYQQLSLSLATAEASVAAMKARVQEYEKRYLAVKATANTIPQVEAEYTQLTRDYEVTQKNYQTLLARREQAQISGEMEASSSVMDFRIIDPPQVPSAPSGPNRPLLISGVLLGALAAGIGFAIILSQLRPVFHDERRLREVSKLPVLGSVIMVWNQNQKSSQRKSLIKFLLTFFSLVSAYAAIIVSLAFMATRA